VIGIDEGYGMGSRRDRSTIRRMELEEILAGAAASLAEVEASPGDGGTAYARRGRTFAVAAAGGVELRLDGAIASAALRTPDVRPSRRGPGWIAFRPRTTDRFALDRARSWFEAAWRHADTARLN
jgi:hypothetical protein